jgi:catechol 2,3-dioxygenase-like lactoylglutathione lyase family enzyme
MRLYLLDYGSRVMAIEVVDHPGGLALDDYAEVVDSLRFGPASSSTSDVVGPDEAWILFSAAATDPDESEPHDAIYLVRPDGTGLHRLVHQMYGSEVRATWSPDGSQVAYVQTTLDTGPEGGIYVVNADGSNPHRVYECAEWCNTTDYLDWASDGAIYVGIDSNVPADGGPPLTFEIWRIDPQSGEAQAVLRREDGLTVEQPRVSPDGTGLVYVRVRLSDEKWAIFASEMNSENEVQLTGWDLNASYPDWGANGLISFNTNDMRLRFHEPHTIYTTPRGLGPRAELRTHDPAAPRVSADAGHARWLPDGSGFTFSLLLRGELFLALMDADGSHQRLVPGAIKGGFSEWRPTP